MRVSNYIGLAKNIKILGCLERLRILNKGGTFSYIYFLVFEEKCVKISDCRTFNYFKTVSGCRTFSHFIVGTSATLTVCVIILICCFAWTTTWTTLSSASSSPRTGNFNWPLVLFNKDGKLQSRYLDKSGGSQQKHCCNWAFKRNNDLVFLQWRYAWWLSRDGARITTWVELQALTRCAHAEYRARVPMEKICDC